MGEDSPHLPHFPLSYASILKKNGETEAAHPLDDEAAALAKRHPE
jgi:hypothetical protein